LGQQNELDEVVISAEGLTKKFGSEIGVQDVTFNIARGKTLGFIGPSGSGKTTTVRLLAGIYKPTADLQANSG
jgi:ABC-2 type transport system ATP-binding protein